MEALSTSLPPQQYPGVCKEIESFMLGLTTIVLPIPSTFASRRHEQPAPVKTHTSGVPRARGKEALSTSLPPQEFPGVCKEIESFMLGLTTIVLPIPSTFADRSSLSSLIDQVRGRDGLPPSVCEPPAFPEP